MKFLPNATFEAVNNLLCFEDDDYIVEGRIESYSCKMTNHDKRLFRDLTQQNSPKSLQALSPPIDFKQKNCFSSLDKDSVPILCDTISTKTLFYLTSTLNASFNPDYDFSVAKSNEFTKELNLQCVIDSIESQLLTTNSNQISILIKNQLWNTINDEIVLNECDIFSYNPDFGSDPYGEDGCVWSFNYFFYNPKLKRIVFFTCKAARTKSKPIFDDEDAMFDYE